MRSIRECPICANNIVSKLYTQKFAQTDFANGIRLLPETYDIVVCSNCGFVYADTPLDQRNYDKYYEYCSKYEGQENVSSGGMSASDVLRYKYVIMQLKKAIDKNTEILDIGCANGGLLMELKTNGYVNLSGLDPS